MKICIYGGASSKIDKSYIYIGEELGEKLSDRGHDLVFGGGRNGMMGAVARGVQRKNGNIIGISPKFFEENNAEVSFLHCTEFIYTETMRERKQLLEEKSDAFIVTPGGIGTFDEFFEILTLKQLGCHNKPIVVLNINGYYDNLLNMMNDSIEQTFITKDCVELFKVTTTVDETLEYIENYDSTDIDLSRVKIR